MSSTATPSSNAASLLAPIAEDMQQVNRVIRHRLASDVMLINQISEYIISAGGKRLRPALLLLVAGALGETTGHRHELAAVVEFIHTATLLHVDVARYMQVIRYKTAKLFEAAAQLGAVLAGADAKTEAAAAEFGRRIGTAFQIMDDWLDYTGTAESMGKNAGDDLREGKPTLPLIYLIERGTPEQSALAREAIEQGGTDRFETIFEAITRSGALDHTLECAKQEAQAAAAAISSFPDSIYKESLLELCSYSTARQS